ncbi:MAG: sulfatase-like hydrolase/transferase [Pseudomonadota bacterium]
MPETEAQAADAPNLLFLFSDQHAQRVAGCFGDPVVETPNLDGLAADGVMFDNCYTPSPICVPARMAMLTGLHPHQQCCWTNDDVLNPEQPTWPQALGAADVHTALIGRMHAMGADQMRGYAEREVGDHSPNWPGVPRHDMGVLDKTNDPHRESLERSGVGQNAYQVLDEATADAAVAWLQRWAASNRDGKDRRRFALTVGFMLPHAPFVAWPDDYARYEGRVPPPRLAPPADEHPWIAWWRRARNITDVPHDTVIRARQAYYALVTHLDRLIGKVISALHETGLSDNTLIVYSSDHGEQIGERSLWWKHTFYDESAKVPLILSWSGRLPKGQRCKHVVTLHDVAATMIDAMGAPALPDSNGRSLLPIADGRSDAWVDCAYSEYCTDAVPDWTGGMAVRQRMLRSGRWKLIDYHGYAPQLFDLETDPDELHDLVASPAHASVRQDLQAQVHATWNPDLIQATMERRRRNKDLQAAWARNVRPRDTIRFQTTPDMNWLDEAES